MTAVLPTSATSTWSRSLSPRAFRIFLGRVSCPAAVTLLMYDSTRPNKNSLDLSSSSGAATGRVAFCAVPLAPCAPPLERIQLVFLDRLSLRSPSSVDPKVPSWPRRTDTDKRGDGIRLVRE